MGRRLCNPLPPGHPPPQSYVAPVSPEDYLEKGYSLHTMGVFYCGPGRELQTTLSAQWALPLLLFFTQTLFYYILTPHPSALHPPPCPHVLLFFLGLTRACLPGGTRERGQQR